jgi:hypothetical protein
VTYSGDPPRCGRHFITIGQRRLMVENMEMNYTGFMANRKQATVTSPAATPRSDRSSAPKTDGTDESSKFWEDWEVTSADDVWRDTLPLRREAQLER